MAYYANVVPSYGNVSILGGTGSTVYTLSGNGGYSGTWATSAATSPYVTVGTTNSSALQVSGDADIKGTLRVKGVDIGELLTKIQDRLYILVPDPERLERYEALKQAYDHYKTLEALCVEENNPKQAR